jgi:hypothetical protein
MAACNGHNNNNVIMEKHPMLSNGGSVVRSTSVPVMVNNGMLRQQQTGKKHQPTAAGVRQSKKNAVMKSPSHQQLLNGTNSPFATKKSIGGTTKIPILRESSSSSAAVRSASTDVKTTIRKLFR